METTLDEDAMNIVEMTQRDLEQYVNLVDKAVEELGGLTSILKDVLCIKYCQTTLHTSEKLLMKGKVNRYGKLHCLILRNCHNHHNPQQPNP